MVSLTSMLVLVSLFSQSGDSVPKTAYLKLIDVWFVALLFMDFLVILGVVYIEYLRLKDNTKPLKKLRVVPMEAIVNSKYFDCNSSNRVSKWNSFFISFFPIVHLLFIVIFTTIAITSLMYGAMK